VTALLYFVDRKYNCRPVNGRDWSTVAGILMSNMTEHYLHPDMAEQVCTRAHRPRVCQGRTPAGQRTYLLFPTYLLLLISGRTISGSEGMAFQLEQPTAPRRDHGRSRKTSTTYDARKAPAELYGS
jgi:hypothetical protein